MFHLERIQRVATRWVKGIRDLNYGEGLKALKLQSLEKKKDKKRFGPGSQDPVLHNTTKLTEKQLNCSSSPEGQDYEDRQ